MAYTYTIEEVIRRAKAKSDMKASNFFTQEDWIDAFNEAWTDLYDILVESGESYFVSEHFFTLSNGETDYDLPSDFYKALHLDFEVNGASNIYVTLKRFEESERNNTVGNVSAIPSGRVRLRYYPKPTKYTSSDLATPIEAYAGWEKYIVNMMAAIALDAEESNSDRVYGKAKEYEQKIRQASRERDYHMTATVQDVYRLENSLYFPSLRYQFYGDQVRFLATIQMGI